MSEEKFMNYGRVIILVFTALIGMLSRLESKLLEIQILKIEKELQKIN
ncbi:MAG: hypothetical protein J0I53_07720 [Chryseobacterium sp.]|nr:hypothetical protein [Chryseobacterium sp.]